MRDCKFVLVLRAISKITQMSGRSGNELIINRGQFLAEGDLVGVPQLSANSMRHSAVREPGGLWLIDQYGLAGTLRKEVLRLLIGGGNNATLAGGAESLARFAAMREALPLLGLLGCGLPDGPKPGSLRFSDATLICNETREYVQTIAPRLELPHWLRPARTCVGKWTNYRHDPVEQRADMLADPREEAEHSGMIFGGEAIVPGSLFVCEVTLEGATELEIGALLWSLRLWHAAGGHIGGMSARGNGRMVAMLDTPDDVDADALADAYCQHAIAAHDAALAWLSEVYETKAEKTARKSRKKSEPVEAP